MQIMTYFLASIISYLGLLAGVILVKMAPEEQNPGKKYFILIKKIIFLLIIAFLLAYYQINFIFSSFLLLFLFILMLAKKIRLEKSALAYFFLGIVLSLSSKFTDLFIIESALVFLYGIAAGSLLLKQKSENYREIFVSNLWFFAPVVILYFII